MKNQMILFSTPNSGSDWFAENIARSDPQKRYFREFFNPITNDKYIEQLSVAFGCEFISTYKNIARLNKEKCEQVYRETWAKETFNFTKENYSVFKIPFFVEKFNCIALTRKIENTFPPSRRNRVFWWYDCIYNSMLVNLETLPKKTKKMMITSEKTIKSIVQKILMCHHIYQETLVEYCREYEIPIIAWESLMGNKPEMIKELSKMPCDIEEIVNRLIETRDHKPKSFGIYNFHPISHLEEQKRAKLL